MTRAVYLVGAPGVGKTSLMRALKAPYLEGEPRRAWAGSLLWVTPLYQPDTLVGVELGRARERFGGTDALGMAVMPHAKQWLNREPLPGLVFGEGARLGTVPFLAALGLRSRLIVIHLTASPRALAVRRAARKSTQDPAWMRGAETRASNTAARLRDDYTHVRVVELDATHATPRELAAHLMETLT